jgi:L-cysteine desulfidase
MRPKFNYLVRKNTIPNARPLGLDIAIAARALCGQRGLEVGRMKEAMRETTWQKR